MASNAFHQFRDALKAALTQGAGAKGLAPGTRAIPTRTGTAGAAAEAAFCPAAWTALTETALTPGASLAVALPASFASALRPAFAAELPAELTTAF